MNNQMSIGNAVAQRRIEDETDKLVESLINDKKITRPNWWVSQRGRFGLFVVALILCAIISTCYQVWLSLQPKLLNLPNGAQFATALISATAAFFAYYQWTDSRREASIDKFYERLGLTNERYYSWDEARQVVGHFWGNTSDEAEFRRRMYVFLELDNLEYIISRYQLGFVNKPLLRRAIRTFRSRCISVEFSHLAAQLVYGSGYQPHSVDAVSVIVASIQRIPADQTGQGYNLNSHKVGEA